MWQIYPIHILRCEKISPFNDKFQSMHEKTDCSLSDTLASVAPFRRGHAVLFSETLGKI